MSNKIDQNAPDAAATDVVQSMVRYGHRIPKPNSWEDFQNKCMELFRQELKDPNLHLYGRGGQKQHGIDLLGCRNGDPNQRVGVQVRDIEKPLVHKRILADCQDAVSKWPDITEILFACTAEDDTHATDAAGEVQEALRAQGKSVRVIVLGWGSIENIIRQHDSAYAAFYPAGLVTNAARPFTTPPEMLAVLEGMSALLEKHKSFQPAGDPGQQNRSDADPALHARIDEYRDLLKLEGEAKLSCKRLMALLEGADLLYLPDRLAVARFA